MHPGALSFDLKNPSGESLRIELHRNKRWATVALQTGQARFRVQVQDGDDPHVTLGLIRDDTGKDLRDAVLFVKNDQLFFGWKEHPGNAAALNKISSPTRRRWFWELEGKSVAVSTYGESYPFACGSIGHEAFHFLPLVRVTATGRLNEKGSWLKVPKEHAARWPEALSQIWLADDGRAYINAHDRIREVEFEEA
jgi:hypothetical protein